MNRNPSESNYQALHLSPRLAIYPNLNQCHSDYIYSLVAL